MLRRVAFALSLVVAGSCASSVLAQGTPPPDAGGPSAEELFREGVALLGEGRFAEAREVLARAFELEPRASTAFNLASAELRTGDPMRAHLLVERLGAGELGPLPDGFGDALGTLRESIDAALGRIEVGGRGPPRIEVLVDDESVGQVTSGATLTRRLDPGVHDVVGRAEGFVTRHERVDLSPGAVVRVWLDLSPTEPEPGAPASGTAAPNAASRSTLPSDAEAGGSTGAWLFVGGGLVIAIGAAIAIGVLLSSGGNDGPRLDCEASGVGCIDT